MALGLSRSLNLSEKNLNLKEAVQKLYAPGIQDDIDLFSLTSQIKSFIFSGPESDDNTQIIGLRSESLKQTSGTVIKRTKFLTKGDTYSEGDAVWFDKYDLALSQAANAVNPIFVVNGSLPDLNFLYSGKGYYFKEGTSTGETIAKNFTGDLVIEDVVLEGDISKADNARATVTFKEQTETVFGTFNVASWKEAGTTEVILAGNIEVLGASTNTLQVNTDGSWVYSSPDEVLYGKDVKIDITYTDGTIKKYTLVSRVSTGVDSSGNVPLAPDGAPEYLTKWTGFYTRRFYVDSVTITNYGTGYLIGENLKIKVETTVINSDGSVPCVIDRQEGKEFFAQEPIVIASQYYYEVRNASQNGFYLFDKRQNKFIYLNVERGDEDFNTIGAREIRILRDDAVYINNILQLKFAQSPIWIEGYGDSFRAGSSLTGAVFSLTGSAAALREDSYRSIQNTKNPKKFTSNSNTLGFDYNRILGQNVAVYQRVVMRDQDFVLGTTGVNGIKLKENVIMPDFELLDTITVTSGSFVTGAQYTILTVGTTDFTAIGASANTVGTTFFATGQGDGTGTATTPDPSSVPLRVPGLFIKVGAEYKRAFSTTAKPFFEDGTGSVENPDMKGSTYGAFSLFAANKYSGSFYAYDTVLDKFAQHISVPDASADAGKNGALYFHRNVAPVVESPAGTSYYKVPLFTMI